jgi:hypothetical protein
LVKDVAEIVGVAPDVELELVVELDDDELPQAATTTATTTVNVAANIRLLFTIAPSSPRFIPTWTITVRLGPRPSPLTLPDGAADVHPS